MKLLSVFAGLFAGKAKDSIPDKELTDVYLKWEEKRDEDLALIASHGNMRVNLSETRPQKMRIYYMRNGKTISAFKADEGSKHSRMDELLLGAKPTNLPPIASNPVWEKPLPALAPAGKK